MAGWSIAFGTQVCGDLAAGGNREWLVADGCGGYAMGTVSGLRTRRYHGLLIAAGRQPGIRRLALAALDPVLEVDGARIELAVHEWESGSIAPRGHRLLANFTLEDGLPVWRWQAGSVVLERRLAMAYGRPAVGVVHRQLAGPPVTLRLKALCTWRDAHGERYASGPPVDQQPAEDGALIENAYRIAGPGFVPDGRWYHGTRLREEANRGLAATEDLWCAGDFRQLLEPGRSLDVTAWAGELHRPPPTATTIVADAATRGRAIVLAARPDTDHDAAFALAADAFVIRGPDVVAGYPWFGAWSRDTMTSYEGLFLASGRANLGRSLLRRYTFELRDGMLPNTTDSADDSGPTDFHSIDAPLWLVHAIGAHVTATKDTDLAADLLPATAALLDGYFNRLSNGLPMAGSAATALTWMDARVDGAPVTPRGGTPVEIAALWVNALGVSADLLAATGTSVQGRESRWYRARHDEAVIAFDSTFGAGSLLPDVVAGNLIDRAARPNQILAYSLPHGPRHGRRPPPEISQKLLTPMGLRTLATDEPGYQGRHQGDPASRDGAYHQGTVWPWLMGPYHAMLDAAGQPTGGLLDGLLAHLGDHGLGSISETADGDAPHGATGCPFQAWSVAQVWQAYRRERS